MCIRSLDIAGLLLRLTPRAFYMVCLWAVQKLSRELGELYSRRLLDGFNLWMYGVVLRDLLPSPTPPAAAQAHQRPRQALILAFPCPPTSPPLRPF